MLCHRTELPNDGDFLKFKTPVGDVVVFNDQGELVAFDNRCPHRGAFIYHNDSGNQANTCKYHGWTYKSGTMHIPSIEQFKKCSIGTVNLRKYKLEWCADFIFVGIDPVKDLYTQLDAIAEDIENISFNINGRLDLHSYEFECAWQIALENALEPYHISMIHQNTLGALKLEDGINDFFGPNSVWRTPIGNKRIKNQLEKLNLFFKTDYSYPGYMSIFMFPFTMISSTFGYSYSLQNFLPNKLRIDRTNFTSRLFSCHVKDDHSKKIIQPFLDSVAKVNRQIFEEDHQICKSIPTDSWSVEPLDYMSNQEIKIEHFRNYCRAEKTRLNWKHHITETQEFKK